MAPKAPGLFAAVWQDVTGGWSLVTGEIDQFVHDKALLEFISGVCDAISTVTGLLALIPSPFSLVLAGIAMLWNLRSGVQAHADGVLLHVATDLVAGAVAITTIAVIRRLTRLLSPVRLAGTRRMVVVRVPGGIRS